MKRQLQHLWRSEKSGRELLVIGAEPLDKGEERVVSLPPATLTLTDLRELIKAAQDCLALVAQEDGVPEGGEVV